MPVDRPSYCAHVHLRKPATYYKPAKNLVALQTSGQNELEMDEQIT